MGDTCPSYVGSWFPDLGLNLHSFHWKHGVVTTGSPGKSLIPAHFKTCLLAAVLLDWLSTTCNWKNTWLFPAIFFQLLVLSQSKENVNLVSCQLCWCLKVNWNRWTLQVPWPLGFQPCVSISQNSPGRVFVKHGDSASFYLIAFQGTSWWSSG